MNGFRIENPGFKSWIDGWLVPLALLTCVGIIIWLCVRHANSFQRLLYKSPTRLFGQLCHAHRLDWTQRRLLRRLAKSQGIEHAVRLFLEPDRFTPAALNPELAPFREEVDRLRRTLFHKSSDQGP